MLETSQTTTKLDEALAKAQAEVSAAVKDHTNPAFRSKYADLASIMDACRAALTSNGIALTQWLVHRDDNRLGIVTRLACAGEWMQATWSMPVSKSDAHGYGSAATYARRYALAAAVGVVADEDDDGNAASEKQKPQTKQAQGKAVAQRDMKPDKEPPPLTAEELEGWKMEIQLAASIGVDKLRELAVEMQRKLSPEQRKQLEPSFRSCERAAKDAYAAKLKNPAGADAGDQPGAAS